MKNVLFVGADSTGGALSHFGLAMEKSLAEIGISFYWLEASETEEFAANLSATLNAREYSFVYSLIGVGKGFASADLPLWDSLGIPLITMYGDSPAYFYDLHANHGNWEVSLYFYEEHLKFRNRFPALGGALEGVAPIIPVRSVAAGEVDLRAKEKGKIFFLKNGNDPQKLREFWKQSFQARVYEALMQISGTMAADLDSCTHVNIVQMALDYLASVGLTGGAEKLLLLMVAQLDDYARRLKSELIADVLLDYPAEVHGVNWEHLNTAGRNGTLVVESNYKKSDALIRDSLAIFDMSPNTVTGMHDRQMRAAAAQTLCVSNRQPLLNQLFPDAELFTYDFNRESLRQKVEWMLAHRSETVELGVACAGKFDETFTMEKTFFQL
ncbi:MAG TPA: hypothetical protein VIF60_15335, partial [Burkholderiaceae bacterium]